MDQAKLRCVFALPNASSVYSLCRDFRLQCLRRRRPGCSRALPVHRLGARYSVYTFLLGFSFLSYPARSAFAVKKIFSRIFHGAPKLLYHLQFPANANTSNRQHFRAHRYTFECVCTCPGRLSTWKDRSGAVMRLPLLVRSQIALRWRRLHLYAFLQPRSISLTPGHRLG